MPPRNPTVASKAAAVLEQVEEVSSHAASVISDVASEHMGKTGPLLAVVEKKAANLEGMLYKESKPTSTSWFSSLLCCFPCCGKRSDEKEPIFKKKNTTIQGR